MWCADEMALIKVTDVDGQVGFTLEDGTYTIAPPGLQSSLLAHTQLSCTITQVKAYYSQSASSMWLLCPAPASLLSLSYNASPHGTPCSSTCAF